MNKTDESILTEQFVSEQFSAVREMLVRNAASLRQNTAEMEQKLRFLQKHQEYLQLQIREKSFFVRLGRFGGLLLSVGKCGLLHPRRGLHLLREIQTIRRSGMFDEIFYLQNNRDLRGRFLFSPIVHFCRNGWLEGRKVKGTIHWVSAHDAAPAEVRLYEQLFSEENPMDDIDGGIIMMSAIPGRIRCFISFPAAGTNPGSP